MHDTMQHDIMSGVMTWDAPAADPAVEPAPPPASELDPPTSSPAAPPAASPPARGTRDPWRLHVLGPVELSYDGRVVEATGLARTLLALLARAPGEEVPTASIVISVWGSDAPDDAESIVASNVARLRKALTEVAPDVSPTQIVVTMPSGYVLNLSPASVDSETFERLLADGRRALAIGQPALAVARLDEALRLWRGRAYEDFGEHSFTRHEAERLEDLRLAAVESSMDAQLALSAPGVPPTLLVELQDLVDQYWHRERLWALLMTALYRLGRRGEALAVYRQAEGRLADGLTIHPGPALKAAERAVLSNSQALLGPALAATEVPEALAATEPECAGRDEEVEWLLAGLDLAATRRGQARLIVGSPGIGKTRLLAAVAQAAAQRAVVVRYARITSGTEPELDQVLRLTPERLNLLLIDDLDLATHGDVLRVADFIRDHREDPVLTLVSCRDQVRVAELGRLPKAVLTALSEGAVAQIVQAYAPGTSTATAAAAMVNTGGVPARVHRAASEWAFGRAGRRIDRAAAAAAEPARWLGSVREEVVAGVLELEHVRARARLLRPVTRDRSLCPYQGLAPFEAADADFFRGRQQTVAQLVSRLVGAPLLALIGPRGSGKSSVLRAGLLPALAAGALPESARWRQLVLTPSSAGSLSELLASEDWEPALLDGEPDGEATDFVPTGEVELAPVGPDWAGTAESSGTDEPVGATESRVNAEPVGTAESLGTAEPAVSVEPASLEPAVSAEPVGHTLLLLDQFEEAYTLLDEDAKAELLDAVVLAAASGDVTIVLGLRSEFYPAVAAHPQLAELITANTMLLAPMSDEELRQAVVEPAELVGLRVEERLADTLVAVAPDAGLAALSLTLQRLWHERDGDLLTLSAYHNGPGLPTIIAATGEAALAALGSDAQRQAAGRILASLAARSTEEVLVARAQPVARLLATAGPGGPDALAALAERGLISVIDGMAEVAHEELLVSWPRLRGWLDEESAQQAVRTHLSRAASFWATTGARPEHLYRGARLAAALEFAAATPGALTAVEREFLTAAHRAVTAAETRRRRQVSNLWHWLIAMGLALAAAIAAGILVFIAWHDATSSNARADAAAAGAAALAEPDLRRALLLSVAATRLDATATGALRQVLLRSPDLLTRAGEAASAVAVSPDGTLVAAAGTDGVWIRAAGTLAPAYRLSLAGHAPVTGLAFTPDGRRLVSWAGNAQHPAPASIVVWDLAQREPAGAAFGQSGAGAGGGLLADATTLVLGQPGTASLVAWNLDSRTPSTAYDLPAGVRGPVVVAGHRIAFATSGGVSVVDLAAHHRVDLPGAGRPSSLSPDGARLLTIDGPDLSLWSVADARRLGTMRQHTADVRATAWAPDGSRFASADAGGAILVWRPGSTQPARTVTGAGAGVSALRFAPDARTLYTAGSGGLIAWDLTGTRGVGARVDDDASLAGVACMIAGRELSAEEWHAYLPRQPYRHVCPE